MGHGPVSQVGADLLDDRVAARHAHSGDTAPVSFPSRCAVCGRPLSQHDRDVRFALPDPVLALPQREASAGTWMSHRTARESVMMQVPNAGAFVRVLLPVHLSGEDSVTFGIWLAIDPRNDRLRSLYELWWDDAKYADLRLDGWLANAVRPWGLLGKPVSAGVRTVSEVPYCTASSDETVTAVLTTVWDRDWVLTATGQA